MHLYKLLFRRMAPNVVRVKVMLYWYKYKLRWNKLYIKLYIYICFRKRELKIKAKNIEIIWQIMPFYFFYVHVTVHRDMWPCIVTNFFIIKPTRCTNFTNLFCHENLHVSDSSSVHHQEFIHCTLSNGICHTVL